MTASFSIRSKHHYYACIYIYILKNLDSLRTLALLTDSEISLGLIVHLITYLWWIGALWTHHCESICTKYFSQCYCYRVPRRRAPVRGGGGTAARGPSQPAGDPRRSDWGLRGLQLLRSQRVRRRQETYTAQWGKWVMRVIHDAVSHDCVCQDDVHREDVSHEDARLRMWVIRQEKESESSDFAKKKSNVRPGGKVGLPDVHQKKIGFHVSPVFHISCSCLSYYPSFPRACPHHAPMLTCTVPCVQSACLSCSWWGEWQQRRLPWRRPQRCSAATKETRTIKVSLLYYRSDHRYNTGCTWCNTGYTRTINKVSLTVLDESGFTSQHWWYIRY